MNTEETRVRSYVKTMIDRHGWGPFEAGLYALDRDLIVSEFRAAVGFMRLCLDDPERKQPAHLLAHRAVRVKACVGPGFADLMAKKLGISDTRAQHLIAQLDQDVAAFEGLVGSGGE